MIRTRGRKNRARINQMHKILNAHFYPITQHPNKRDFYKLLLISAGLGIPQKPLNKFYRAMRKYVSYRKLFSAEMGRLKINYPKIAETEIRRKAKRNLVSWRIKK